MKTKFKKLFNIYCFQIGVNIIGLPEYLEIRKDVIVVGKAIAKEEVKFRTFVV